MAAMTHPSAWHATGKPDLPRQVAMGVPSTLHTLQISRADSINQLVNHREMCAPGRDTRAPDAKSQGDGDTDDTAVQADASEAVAGTWAGCNNSEIRNDRGPSASGGESDTSTPPRQLATTAAAAAAAAAAAIAAVIDAPSSTIPGRLTGRGPPPLSSLCLSTARDATDDIPLHASAFVSQWRAAADGAIAHPVAATFAAGMYARPVRGVDGCRAASATAEPEQVDPAVVGGGLRNDFDTDSDSEGDVDGPAVLYHGSHGTVVPLQGANPPGANPLSILVGAAAMANGGPAAGYGMYPAPVMLGHGFGHHGHGHHGHLGHALHHGHSAGAGLGGQPVGFFPHGQGVQGGGRAHSPAMATAAAAMAAAGLPGIPGVMHPFSLYANGQMMPTMSTSAHMQHMAMTRRLLQHQPLHRSKLPSEPADWVEKPATMTQPTGAWSGAPGPPAEADYALVTQGKYAPRPSLYANQHVLPPPGPPPPGPPPPGPPPPGSAASEMAREEHAHVQGVDMPDPPFRQFGNGLKPREVKMQVGASKPGETADRLTNKIVVRIKFEESVKYGGRANKTAAIGQTSFPCCYKNCERKFTRPSHLRNHLYTHTGERPFACQICQKSFGTNWALTKHTRIHTMETPYSCGLCNIRFSQRSSWRRHNFTLHPAIFETLMANNGALPPSNVGEATLSGMAALGAQTAVAPQAAVQQAAVQQAAPFDPCAPKLVNVDTFNMTHRIQQPDVLRPTHPAQLPQTQPSPSQTNAPPPPPQPDDRCHRGYRAADQHPPSTHPPSTHPAKLARPGQPDTQSAQSDYRGHRAANPAIGADLDTTDDDEDDLDLDS